MFITNERYQVLKGLEQGRKVTLVITGATQNCELQFQHGGDTTWYAYPGFSGAHAGGVIVENFTCISSKMRVAFDAVPTGDYQMNTIAEAVSDF